MGPHLLELAQNYFLGSTVRQLSTAFDESESRIQGALASVVPLALGGLVAHAQQPGGAARLLDLAQQVHSQGLLGDLSRLLAGLSGPPAAGPAAEPALVSRGEDMLHTLLGTAYEPAVASVSHDTGARPATISKLLSVAVAVGLGLLGRHAAQQPLDAAGLQQYLVGQGEELRQALASWPDRLGRGAAAPATAPVAAEPAEAASPAAASPVAPPSPPAPPIPGDSQAAAASASEGPVYQEHNPEFTPPAEARPRVRRSAGPRRWLGLLGLLVLALGAVVYFGGIRRAQPTAQLPNELPAARPGAARPLGPPPGHYEAASDRYRYEPGPGSPVQLPTGASLSVGANATEAQLLYLLTAAPELRRQAQPPGGLILDRVYFEPASARLTAESQAQLDNLSALLRAFPDAHLKIGGFTDAQGPAEANLLLSADRANAVRNKLLAAGIEPTRLAAQGYGQAHPVAGNDTPAGRAQNRRVAILITN